MSVLLVTEHAGPSPRLLRGLAEAGALPGPATGRVGLATFSAPPDGGVAAVHRLGVRHLSLSATGAPTPELALAGACEALGVERLLVWSSPRAIAALHALRGLRTRPRVQALLPLTGTSGWDEARLTGVRALNLVDEFLVEDDETHAFLSGLGASPQRLRRLPPPDRGEPAGGPAILVVHSGSPGRRRHAARALAAGLRGTGGTVSCMHFRGAFALAAGTAGHLRGTCAFVEDDLCSSAPLEALRARGWRVAAPEGAAASRMGSDPGFTPLRGDPSTWPDQLGVLR